MTKKEMTELFSVMLLAWPNAEMFKGGMQKLGPTIELWTACTADVDFWTGQQAVIRLCKTNKFPPTIAEFLEQVGGVRTEIKSEISLAWNGVKFGSRGLTPGEWYATLRPGEKVKEVVDQMGGPEKLLEAEDFWKPFHEFERIYELLIRQSMALPSSSRPAIGGTKQIGGR